MKQHPGSYFRFASYWALALFVIFPAHAQLQRPSSEFRPISTDRHEIIVQKNGRVDVNLRNAAPVFQNAYPMVWFEGDDEPKEMKIDGRLTTRREFNDALGQGQEMVFQHKDTEWYIRVYPLHPFITVQCVYTNDDDDDPVTIKALYPWASGEPKRGGMSLGRGTASALSMITPGGAEAGAAVPRFVTGEDSQSNIHSLIVNPLSARVLHAGFLTHNRAWPTIEYAFQSKDELEEVDPFYAKCVFDPPVTLQPGERLASELLYIAISERSPSEAWKRYGEAYAVFHGDRKRPEPLPNRFAVSPDTTADELVRTARANRDAALNARVTEIHLPLGWQDHHGDWNPQPDRFPQGLRPVVDELHDLGYSVSLSISPFTVDAVSELARYRPSWMLESAADQTGAPTSGNHILDITAPGAYDYIVDLVARINDEWNIDTLTLSRDTDALLFADGFSNANATRLEAFNMGMNAVTEAFNGPIISEGGRFITAVPAHGLRMPSASWPASLQGPAATPWRQAFPLVAPARYRAFLPHAFVPVNSVPVIESPGDTTTTDTTRATATALMGGATTFSGEPRQLTAAQRSIAARAWPPLDIPADVTDFFERDLPSLWSTILEHPAGDWYIVAAFNWSETTTEVARIDLGRLGLPANTYFTVFDFWHESYLGTVDRNLIANVPPKGVRLLALREFGKRPMVAGTNSHITQGALELSDVNWNAETATLSGSFEPLNADMPATLYVHVPEGFAAPSASINGEGGEILVGEGQAALTFPIGAGPYAWSIQF